MAASFAQTVGLYDHFHGQLESRVTTLQRTGLFNSVDSVIMRELGVLARMIKYNRGDLIVRQGDPAECFYVLCKGVCQVRD